MDNQRKGSRTYCVKAATGNTEVDLVPETTYKGASSYLDYNQGVYSRMEKQSPGTISSVNRSRTSLEVVFDVYTIKIFFVENK